MPCVREFGPPTPSLNKILQIRHGSREQTCNVQKAYRKIDKIQNK